MPAEDIGDPSSDDGAVAGNERRDVPISHAESVQPPAIEADQSVGAVSTTALVTPLPPSLAAVRDAVTKFLVDATQYGLFPVVAWGADPNAAPDTLGLLTCPIPDFPIALDLVERSLQLKMGKALLPGQFIPLRLMMTIGEKNRLMSPVSAQITGLDTHLPEHRKIINRLIAYCTASRFRSRAFMLVDIVGFSLLPTPEQLALRMSLGQSINQCRRRMQYLFERELILIPQFDRISTGDGCYVWNWSPYPESAVSTFVLLILLMTQCEALRHRSNLRLRAAFGIGEAYTFPYEGPGISPNVVEAFMPDAIGPVLNNLQRLISVAAPGQILVEPGREERHGERLDVNTLLTRVRSEILPAELEVRDSLKPHDIVLKADPPRCLRVTDKHKEVHHCYNVWGKIPNRDVGAGLNLQTIGLAPDDAIEVSEARFTDPR
jgi:hypothetical protein